MAKLSRIGSALIVASVVFSPISSIAAVKGEAEMEKLGLCVAENGKDKCKSQAKAACKVIYSSSFTKGASSASQIKLWEKNGKPDRWKQATANLVLKQVGFGSKFCY